MRIGELLLMNGIITERQLEQALEQQQSRPIKLGELLIDSGAITERQLVEALEFQLGVSVLEFKDLVSHEDCAQLVPESLVHQHCLLPLEQIGGKLSVALYDPSNNQVLDELRKASGMEIQPYLATRGDLERAIHAKYGAALAVQLCHAIIEQAIAQGTSDLFIDPSGEGLVIRTRQNKRLVTMKTIPPEMKTDLIQAMKRFAALEPDSNFPQEGRLNLELGSSKIKGRVFTLPHASGESLALQVREKKSLFLQSESLGFHDNQLSTVREQLQKPGRIVLFTSPPAHGTTSMLYSFMDELAKDDRKAMAVEVEPEHQIRGVYHLACNLEYGFTVAEAIRSSIRHNPDMIMAGDIMDKEAFECASQAALTGPLVIAGGSGSSALDSLRRLFDLNVNRPLLASSLSMIVNQRVIRKLCKQCVQTVTATDEEIQHFEKEGLLQSEDERNKNKPILGNFRTFISTHKAGRLLIYRSEGCKLCNGTGYQEQTATHEVLVIDAALKSLILEGRSMEEIEQDVKAKSNFTHLHYGLRKVKEGITTFEEIMKHHTLE